MNKLAHYKPYRKQAEWHAAGTWARERALIAGNQLGKTLSAGSEYAMHLTGRYESSWPGRVWGRPVVGWIAGESAESTRDNPQRMLMGRINAFGTGTLPADSIKDFSRRRGVADALDTVIVKHGGGGDVQAGESLVSFKSYDQGKTKFQGETLDLGWCDEEPPEDVYAEFLVRLQALAGSMMATFTPLKGMSTVVHRFMRAKEPGTFFVQMGIRDVDHYTEERKAEIIASYLAHEREARANGVPTLGSGAIFPVPDALIKFNLFVFPDHWPRWKALDFGWTHPTAIVWLIYDPDNDVIYIYDCYRVREQLVPVHAAVMTSRPDKWSPCAWPHDGHNDTAAGPQLSKQYADAGVPMMANHAQYEDVPGDEENPKRALNSVEAGLSDMLTRMFTGRLKVASHLEDWFEEKHGYHRKDGKVVKEVDDLMSATRYGVMTKRFAITAPALLGRVDHGRKASWRS